MEFWASNSKIPFPRGKTWKLHSDQRCQLSFLQRGKVFNSCGWKKVDHWRFQCLKTFSWNFLQKYISQNFLALNVAVSGQKTEANFTRLIHAKTNKQWNKFLPILLRHSWISGMILQTLPGIKLKKETKNITWDRITKIPPSLNAFPSFIFYQRWVKRVKQQNPRE